MPWVEVVDQPLDGAALAGGVPALEDHAQRRPDLTVADLPAQRESQLQQPALLLGQLLLLLLLGQPETEIHRIESAHGSPACTPEV